MAAALLAVGCGEVNRAPGADGGNGPDASDSDDTTPPTVTATDPEATEAGIREDAVITATFSEAMDPETLTDATFLVVADGVVVQGDVSYEDGVATFTPSEPLAGGTPYIASITTGAADAAGNRLAEPHDWAFATVTTRCVKTDGGNGCHPTIAAAVLAAAAGESIAVAAGTYVENVTIDKTVTLLGGYNTDLDVRDPATLISELNPADASVPIVRVTGVFNDTAAVAPIIDGFTVSGGRSTGDHGGAFSCSSSDVQLRHNVIVDNQGFFLGGAVYLQYGAGRLVGNRIENSSVGGQPGSSGGGVALEITTATLIDNVIADNDAPEDMDVGGGVYITGGGPVRLIDNEIVGNRVGGIGFTGSGGGIAIFNSEVHIVGGVIAENETISTGPGGGIYASGSVVTLEGVLVSDNGPAMAGTGSGIVAETTALTLGSSIVAGNRNGEAGVWLGADSASAIINCTITGNPGSGVRTESPLTLANTIVLGEPVGVNVTAAVEVIALNNDFFDNATDTVGFTLDGSNILVDPLLDESLHLTDSSPLLDVGAPGTFMVAGGVSTVALPEIDIDGEPRAITGPSESRRVDIGADERAAR
jgi:hypothetical protein